MEQYKKNVQIVMDFLKEGKYSPSLTSLHLLCYKDLRNYLLWEGLSYSFIEVSKWIEANKDTWNYRHYTGWKHCLTQLNDVYQIGSISLDHLGPHASANSLL